MGKILEFKRPANNTSKKPEVVGVDREFIAMGKEMDSCVKRYLEASKRFPVSTSRR